MKDKKAALQPFCFGFFLEQVGFKIPQKTLYPGDKIDFELNGSINSYCALNLVDFSTFPGWNSWITKEQVIKKQKYGLISICF